MMVSTATCPFCGCLCDDIEVHIEGNRIRRVRNSCAISATLFLNYDKDRIVKPMIRERGSLREVPLYEAVERVARMLVEADYPALYGWSLSSSEAIRIGLELAEEVGGVMDNQTTVCHGPGVEGLHYVGEPTCSLGEIKNRADLVVFWGCNPIDSHPRHLERYSLASGRFSKGKRVVVVDVRETPMAAKADLFLKMEPDRDFELIAAIRAMLRFEDPPHGVAGITLDLIEEFTEVLRGCRFGVILYGQGLTQTRGRDKTVAALFLLVKDLNEWTKFLAIPMRGHFNVTGANMVCAWITGFPFAVDFSRGYPWYCPGETTFVDVLKRGENDATLVVGSDPVAHLPASVVEHMVSQPLATIDPHMSLTATVSDVVIPSAFTGIEAGGTAYRMDGVPLPMKRLVDPPEGVLSDEEILGLILKRVREIS